MQRRTATVAICAMIVAGLCRPTGAQEDVAAFYRGKQMRIVVGSAAGGGYDLFARIVARHLASYIPGNPTILVQNLAAAGGMVMTNQLFSVGPKDGTVIGAPINAFRPHRCCSPMRPASMRPGSTGSAAPIASPMWRSSGTRCRCRPLPT
jgi:hypothetical protein